MAPWMIPLSILLISLAAYGIALKIFPKMGLLDFPERYGLKRKRLPYPTGIIGVLIFLGFFLWYADWNFQVQGIITGIAVLALFSFIDDRHPLPSWLRLMVQVAVALIIFLTGTRIFSLTNPLDALMEAPVLDLDNWVIASELFSNPSVIGALFTIIWLGMTMNALNWFDGIPGQVSTISTIGFLTIGLLAMSDRVGQNDVAMIAFTLAAISAAGLFFDFPPNKVVMGDTGAMFFGLMLGVLTIYAGGKVATGFLVLGIPLIDFGIVILRRLLKRQSIFRGNAKDEHLHHRLLGKGWNPRRIIALTATIGTLFGITALYLDTLQKFLAALALLMIMAWLSRFSQTSP